MQPLEGLTVLDFTTLLPGPLATLMLAEAGARVIKIERPGGEELHSFPPFVESQSVLYTMLNRGKERLDLDLKNNADLDRIYSKLETADILVEQFRPGVMERLGLGYEALSERFPGLIYCSITGYGQSGPKAQEAGHDLNYLAASGLLLQSCGSLEHPVLPPAQVADIGGGSFPAVVNILLAVLQKQKTGKGCHLDIAMTEAMFTYGLFAHAFHNAGKKVPEMSTGLLTGGSPRYGLYPTADGCLVAVAALEQKFWNTLCDLLEVPEPLRDDRNKPDEVRKAIMAAISRKTAAEWAPLLAAADCCATLPSTFAEARQDPHFAERALFKHRIPLLNTSEVRSLDATIVPISPEFRKPAG